MFAGKWKWGRLRARRLHLLANRVYQAGFQRNASIGQSRAHHAELQSIYGKIALPDAHIGSLAAMPHGVIRKGAPLIGGIGHDSGFLPRDPDIKCAPKSEFSGGVRNALWTDFKRYLIKVDVT